MSSDRQIISCIAACPDCASRYTERISSGPQQQIVKLVVHSSICEARVVLCCFPGRTIPAHCTWSSTMKLQSRNFRQIISCIAACPDCESRHTQRISSGPQQQIVKLVVCSSICEARAVLLLLPRNSCTLYLVTNHETSV